MIYTREQYNTHTRGFSLIEVLVYIAVTVLIAIAAVLTFISLDDVFLRNASERDVTNAATVALERIVRDIRAADGIDSGSSVFGSSPGTLVLTAGPTTTTYTRSADAVTLGVNGEDLGALTPAHISVDELTFQHYTSSTSEMVRVQLTLSSVNRAASVERTYVGSAVMRGTYE